MKKSVNLKKVFVVWFSASPDEFLPKKYQETIKQWLEKYRDLQLTLVIDERLLSPMAKLNLKEFSKVLFGLSVKSVRDIPIDHDEEECQLKIYLEQELGIENPTPINMVSAKNLLTLLPHSFDFGIYMDFDVQYTPQANDVFLSKKHAALLYPLCYRLLTETVMRPAFNHDVIMPVLAQGKVNYDGIRQQVRLAREGMLRYYTASSTLFFEEKHAPLWTFLMTRGFEVTEAGTLPEMRQKILKFFSNKPSRWIAYQLSRVSLLKRPKLDIKTYLFHTWINAYEALASRALGTTPLNTFKQFQDELSKQLKDLNELQISPLKENFILLTLRNEVRSMVSQLTGAEACYKQSAGIRIKCEDISYLNVPELSGSIAGQLSAPKFYVPEGELVLSRGNLSWLPHSKHDYAAQTSEETRPDLTIQSPRQ